VQTCAEEACYNLDDLSSNLGVGRPLARVTSWAWKVVAMKSVLDEIISILLCSDARELLRSAIFLMSGVRLVRDFFDVKMKCSVPT
jgi:hypothetical protein